MNKLTFNLSAGVWRWWFRDKNTLNPLSHICYIELIKNNTEMSFLIPDYLKNNNHVVIYIERCR